MRKLRDIFEPKAFVPNLEPVRRSEGFYTIKPLNRRDLGSLLKLSARCFKQTESYNRETFEYLLREPKVVSYQARTLSNELVGFLFVMGNHVRTAHITTVAVAPEFRLRGIGDRLISHAEVTLRKKGLDSIVLEVRESNSAARRLYSSRGYKVVQVLRSYYADGEDACLMSKSLTS